MVPRSILRFLTTAGLFAALLFPASAATPMFDAVITWEANTLVPIWYTGKIMPNFQTPITARVLMTANNQIVDMRNYSVSWRVNSDIIATDKGLARVLINPETSPIQKLRIQAVIKDDLGEVVASPIVTIERSYPRVVIDSPAPQRRVSGTPVTLTAWPFFFSLTDLVNVSTKWLVDGISVSTDRELTVAATENALPTVRVEAQVESSAVDTESARQSITLLPIPTL